MQQVQSVYVIDIEVILGFGSKLIYIQLENHFSLEWKDSSQVTILETAISKQIIIVIKCSIKIINKHKEDVDIKE